jgi:hypothetical protein
MGQGALGLAAAHADQLGAGGQMGVAGDLGAVGEDGFMFAKPGEA